MYEICLIAVWKILARWTINVSKKSCLKATVGTNKEISNENKYDTEILWKAQWNKSIYTLWIRSMIRYRMGEMKNVEKYV